MDTVFPGTHDELGQRRGDVKTGQTVDEFAYHCAMAPAITSMVENSTITTSYSTSPSRCIRWREAAELMLSGDYYPLTECRKSPEDYYAMQFDDFERRKGFIQIVRNTQVKEDSFTVYPFVDESAIYRLENRETGETMELPEWSSKLNSRIYP